MDKDLTWILSQLNLIAIGRFRLRTFISRYPLKYDLQKKQGQDHVAVKQPVTKVFLPAIRDNRSFVQVVSGKPLTEHIVENNFVDIAAPTRANSSSIKVSQDSAADIALSFSSSVALDNNDKWIVRSIVVRVNDIQSVLKTKLFLTDNNIEFSKISLMGGNLILITFYSREEAIIFMANLSHTLLDFFQTFTWAKGFKQSFCRYVWVSILGLPLTLWNPEIFMAIGDSVGEAIKVHPFILLKNRFDSEIVLLSCTSRLINKSVDVSFKGEKHSVFVVETDRPVVFDDRDINDSYDSDGDTDHSVTKVVESRRSEFSGKLSSVAALAGSFGNGSTVPTAPTCSFINDTTVPMTLPVLSPEMNLRCDTQ